MSTNKVKAVWAQQITSESDIVGAIAKVTCGNYLIIVLADGRWACYDVYGGDGYISLRTNPPSIIELHRAGLLTDAECAEAAQ